jgi:hypothetical protein
VQLFVCAAKVSLQIGIFPLFLQLLGGHNNCGRVLLYSQNMTMSVHMDILLQVYITLFPRQKNIFFLFCFFFDAIDGKGERTYLAKAKIMKKISTFHILKQPYTHTKNIHTHTHKLHTHTRTETDNAHTITHLHTLTYISTHTPKHTHSHTNTHPHTHTPTHNPRTHPQTRNPQTHTQKHTHEQFAFCLIDSSQLRFDKSPFCVT